MPWEMKNAPAEGGGFGCYSHSVCRRTWAAERGTMVALRGHIRWLLALATVVAVGAGARPVDAASACPPGQPPGRPPGQPPGTPGQPPTRPPQYPPGQCQLRLSASAAAPGTAVDVAGSGFAPASAVRISLRGQTLTTASADAAGTVAAAFTVPADAAPGPADVAATGVDATGAPYALAAAFTVLPSNDGSARSAAGSGALVRTGSSSTAPLVGAGVVLVALGLAATVAGRRRRGDSSP